MSINIFLVEDDWEFSKVLKVHLNNVPGLAVQRHSLTLKDARDQILMPEKSRPDVYIVDLALPDGSGLDVIRLIRKLAISARILVISNFGDQRQILESIAAGADGYLIKSEPPERYVESVMSLVTHGGFLSAQASHVVIDRLRNLNQDNVFQVLGSETEKSSTFTSKEEQIIQLLGAGMSAKLIASNLTISIFTVNQHLRNIYRKLQVRNKMDAVNKARKLGWF